MGLCSKVLHKFEYQQIPVIVISGFYINIYFCWRNGFVPFFLSPGEFLSHLSPKRPEWWILERQRMLPRCGEGCSWLQSLTCGAFPWERQKHHEILGREWELGSSPTLSYFWDWRGKVGWRSALYCFSYQRMSLCFVQCDLTFLNINIHILGQTWLWFLAVCH